MDIKYWDDLAPKWSRSVFETCKYDRNRIMELTLQRSAAATGARSVADFGCGIGGYFRLLSPMFEHVWGFDHSSACVERAARLSRRLRNVEVHVSQRGVSRWKNSMDVVLCVNVVIHPETRPREKSLRDALSLLRRGGRFLMVVPSIESACLVSELTRNSYYRAKSNGRVSTGVVAVTGVPTKHFSGEELVALADRHGLDDVEVAKVEFSWQSYGLPPQKRLAGYPWDWLMSGTLRRRRRAS